MKKIKKALLILLLILGFNLNVNAIVYALDPVPTEKSSDANLTSVTVNGQTAICNENNICSLEINDNSVTDVIIKYNLSSEKAKILDEKKELTLVDGENKFEVTVQAEDETTTKKYTIIIIKNTQSTDSSLKKLTINGEAVTLKKGVTKYNATINYISKSIDVEAIPTDDKAKVENAKSNKLTFDFAEEKKEIRIKVISEAGDTTTYVITVTRRPLKEATLRDLKIENYDIDFSKDVTNYEITVLKNVDTLNITPTATDLDAKVDVNAPSTLKIGENTITITVTNDGNVKVYTIKVTKLDQEDKSLANLKFLKVEGFDLDFKEDKYEYDLKIGDINALNIDYETINPDSTVQITGNMDLVDGSIVKIRVTYTSGLTNVYRINIMKDALEKKENNVSKIIIIIVIILIIIAGIVMFIIQYKNKNKGNKKNKNNKKNSKKEVSNENLDKKKNANVNSSDVINIDNNEEEEIEDII